MRLELDKINAQGTPSTAILTHGDKTITWNVALFDKTSFNNDFDIFEQINGYWAHLTMPEQDRIFATYISIHEAFEMLWETNELTMALYGLIKELFGHHPLEKLRHWLDFHAELMMPGNVREAFHESADSSSTREKTYVRDDYVWLRTLSVSLRIMIPIWGEFISRTRQEAGTVFKEYYAFQLLSYANIFHSTPMERLRIYVEKSLPPDKSMAAAILGGGLSSEDFPIWMLGLVLVRRLSVGDVRGFDPNSSLVTFIYKYIDQKAKGHDSSFIGLVKDKIVEGTGQEGENNLSKLEGYKIKQEIPAGDIAIIGHYMEDTLNAALKICPDIDPLLVKQSEQSVLALVDQQIWGPQMVLMQWVLKPVIPSRGLLHMNKSLALRALAVAQALLWHRKHYVLAALVSAIEQDNSEAQQLAGPDHRARITKEQQDVLDQLFPYQRRGTGKKNPSKNKANAKRVNPAAEAIDSVSSALSERAWRLTLPSEWVAEVTGNKSNRRYAVPHDIKVKLADLAISIAQRSF